MSLILEALRKSEAERHRGQAPGLHAELPPPAAIASPRWKTPLWTIGAAAAAVAVVAILWPGERAGRGDHRVSTPPPEAIVPAAPTPAPGPGPEDGQGQAADAAQAHGFPPVERILPPPPTPAPAPVRVPSPAPAASALAPRQAAPPRDADAAVETATPASATSTHAQRLAGLPAAQRQRLPPLKLSMHMWNEDPARRFVVVDGQRRVEGDRLGEAIITAIDREGVLLDLDGQAVRAPLP